MNQKQRILEFAKLNNGVILTKQVTQIGFGRWALKELVDEGKLTLVQHGVYVTQNGYIDDFFLLQYRYPKGIYSHETALYLQGLSDRIPTQITMTFKQGTSVTRMKKDNIRPVITSNGFEIGIIEIERSKGIFIRVYNVERTLTDLLKPKYDADFEQLMPALRRFAARSNKDVNKLFRYANIFGVEEKMKIYLGVLL